MRLGLIFLGFLSWHLLIAQPTFIRSIPVSDGTSLGLDEEPNLYVVKSRKHQFLKFLFSSSYDSCITIGGKGISGEALNIPLKAVAVNRQSVYLLDGQNRRILVLNTNLKVSNEWNFLKNPIQLSGNELFLNPVSFCTNSLGELFLLNGDDNKIYKFDVFGQFQTQFGGLDYGNGSLLAPVDLFSVSNWIYVTDTIHQEIHCFDSFGIFQHSITPNLPQRWSTCSGIGEYLFFLTANNEIWGLHLPTRKIQPLVTMQEKILDFAIQEKQIFLLSNQDVKIYQHR
ncbi:MAG: hypothetical protein NZ108_07675 [Bacteroidia bacterium]|nr:hypothetical protein [Bacteroidia bacterium]